MLDIVASLAPVFLLIVLGTAIRRFRVVDPSFWPPAERLAYFVFFPCLIIASLSGATFGDRPIFLVGAAMVGAIVTMAAFLVALSSILPLSRPAFSSVFQGAIRPNTYVGLAAAQALFGADGVVLLTVGFAFAVPMINVLCVTMLTHFGDTGHTKAGGRLRAALTGIARNPIIWGVLIGGAFNVSGIGQPFIVGDLVSILGRATLPIGLLAVGAALDLQAARAAGLGLVLSSFLKLLALPALTWLLAVLLGLGPLETAIAVIFNALPSASSAYVLARQMGGDHRLMAGIITATTLVAALTLPMVVAAVT